MINKNVEARISSQWDSILFFSAGIFMLVNVASLWIRYYSNFQVSILWAAVPGIIAFAASIIGLLKLYPRISSHTPWLARGGAVLALTAATALFIAAIWIGSIAIFSGGISGAPPNGILALVGVFIVAMVIAFICNAIAFLLNGSSRNVGYLLMVPVVSWALMLIVGIIKGLESGLSLDLYTNGFVAISFLLIGFLLKKTTLAVANHWSEYVIGKNYVNFMQDPSLKKITDAIHRYKGICYLVLHIFDSTLKTSGLSNKKN